MAKPTTEVDLTGFGYERLQHIGRGQYASAQLVRETATGHKYVAKCISLAALNEHDQELANQESILLQTLSHPYIVAYKDSFLIDGESMLVILMEHCDGGDLRKLIKEKAKAGEHLPEDQVMTWFVQLCLALQYCHSEKVLHRDLKTSNIFIDKSGGATVKLGDFGISRVFEGTAEAAVTIVGTPYYMSPEVCRSEPYSWKSDVWALGCVLYELCMLKHAFESTSLLGLVYKIVSDHYEPIPDAYSPHLNDLIRQLLMKNAESRPTINQLFGIPYVKAYLARMGPPPPGSPTLPSEDRLALRSNASPVRQRLTTLRPSGAPRPPAMLRDGSGPPPPPGPPPLAPQSEVLVIASRIRRRLVGQRLNWITAFASFDREGAGSLAPDDMRDAMASMCLGISELEISKLVDALAPTPGSMISMDSFQLYLRDVPTEVLQYEAWARHTISSSAAGRRARDLLCSKDEGRQGTLPPGIFRASLKELVPVLNDQQLDLLVLLADKNALGDVDYAEFVQLYCAVPPQPKASAQPGSPMPPAPPGMPPLSQIGVSSPVGGISSPVKGGASPVDLAMTLTMGDVNALTFFTCTSSGGGLSEQAGAGAALRHVLSAEGCALICSRLKRRLEVAGLSVADTFALFTNPGERELSADQFLEAASLLPLGTSRAEMQQIFSKVDASNAGHVPLAALEAALGRVSSADCAVAPPWILGKLRAGLADRICDELQKFVAKGAPALAAEPLFKRVVMQTERYLTSDQLNSVLLLADKNSSGLLDFREFAERFGGEGAGGTSGLRAPGGWLPEGLSALTELPPEEELRAVGSRTSAVLDRHALAPERLTALMALWGSEAVEPTVLARLLASLPLGLSQQEALAQLTAVGGSMAALPAWLAELRVQGHWARWCDWAAANIPGQKLREVLHRQVMEAECRTLEPREFVRTMVEAGATPPNSETALWLAEKTADGDIYVAEFLTNFAPTEKKKKRGMFYRFMGR